MIAADAIVAPDWKTKPWLSEPVVVGLVRATDCLIVALAGIAAYVTRFNSISISGPELHALVISIILAVNTFKFAGVYGDATIGDVMHRSGRVCGGWMVVMLLTIFVGFLTKTVHEISRIWVVLWFVYGIVALQLSRVALKKQVRRWQKCGLLTHSMVVVGKTSQCASLIERLDLRNDPSNRLLGVFLLDDSGKEGLSEIDGQPVMGGLQDLVALARRIRIDRVVVAIPPDAQDDLHACTHHLRELPTDVCLFPTFGPDVPFHKVSQLRGIPLLHIADKPLAGWGSLIKAIEDRVLAMLLLIIAFPTMLAIAAVIYFESGRPVIFRQKRYGFNNEVIEVFKFRTMRVEEKLEGEFLAQARRNDDRLTRSGKFLRRSSLDELPQLFNVLKGEMSVVGPRPHAVCHNEHYARLIDSYLARHRVKPGITGWAQVNGLRGETRTLNKMERRVKHDLYYIENWSLALDCRVIMLTMLNGFIHPNAY